MDESSVQQQIKDILTTFFSVEVSDVGPDFSINTVENWDSLRHIGLIMAIEQAFNIRIEVEDAAEMTSFLEICKVVSRYLLKE